MNAHVLAAGVFDAAQMQDLGPAGRHLEHLFVTDVGDLPGARHDPRVRGEDAVDIAVDLAVVGAQRGGERHRGGVGGAAAEGGHVLGVLRHALEAGHDHDVALVQRRGDPAGRDVDDPGVAVGAGGDDAGLRAGQRPGVQPLVVDGHGQQGGAHPLAGGQQHVEFPRAAGAGHPEGEFHEFVGGVPHGGDDHHHVVTELSGRHDPLGHALDAVRVCDRRATVLLHYAAHAAASLPLGHRSNCNALGPGLRFANLVACAVRASRWDTGSVTEPVPQRIGDTDRDQAADACVSIWLRAGSARTSSTNGWAWRSRPRPRPTSSRCSPISPSRVPPPSRASSR